MPWMSAPIFTSIRARSCTCGSHAALPITVVPGVSAAAISAFSLAITDGSSMKTSVGRRPCGALSTISPSALHGRAHRAEGIQVRVQPASADHVAAGRRHHRATEPRKQRTGEQERGPDQLGQLALDLDPVHIRGAQQHLVGPAPAHPHPDRAQDAQHRVHVPNPRHVPHHDLVLRQECAGQDRQRPVLVPGRDHRAGKRDPAFDYELLHVWFVARAGAPGGDVRVALCKRNSHLSPPVRARRALPCLGSLLA